MSKLKQGSVTIYRAMRRIVQAFAVFLIFIVAVVAWRKLIVEGKAVTALEYGELVSLGILLAIAGGLWLFAARIKKEADATRGR